MNLITRQQKIRLKKFEDVVHPITGKPIIASNREAAQAKKQRAIEKPFKK